MKLSFRYVTGIFRFLFRLYVYRAFSPPGRRRRHCRRRRRHRRHKLASLPSRCHRLWLIIVAVVPLGFESGAISRGDLILIHANDHALSSQSPPSPPPPLPLAPPCHFILPGTATARGLCPRLISRSLVVSPQCSDLSLVKLYLFT